MKKGNKKVLVIALLLLLIGAGIATYAIYRTSATGTATVATATWSVKVNNTDTETGAFTFSASDITWSTNTSAVSGKIAPGSTGTITLEIDATGSEVNVDYTATVGTIKVGNENLSSDAGFTVTPHDTTDGTGTINYSTTANAMKKTLTFDVVWTGTDSDTTAKDQADMAMDGINITIPVTVTAKQHLGA